MSRHSRTRDYSYIDTLGQLVEVIDGRLRVDGWWACGDCDRCGDELCSRERGAGLVHFWGKSAHCPAVNA